MFVYILFCSTSRDIHWDVSAILSVQFLYSVCMPPFFSSGRKKPKLDPEMRLRMCLLNTNQRILFFQVRFCIKIYVKNYNSIDVSPLNVAC